MMYVRLMFELSRKLLYR